MKKGAAAGIGARQSHGREFREGTRCGEEGSTILLSEPGHCRHGIRCPVAPPNRRMAWATPTQPGNSDIHERPPWQYYHTNRTRAPIRLPINRRSVR